ncbi:hypothetical protein V1522DRAFT_431935 [Lipomyces starkeyi]
MIIGAIIQATSSFELVQIFFGRIISGIGIGIVNSTAPIVQAEVSPKATRGLFVGMYCSTLNFGIVTDTGLTMVCHSTTLSLRGVFLLSTNTLAESIVVGRDGCQ